jgi:hypothetical protein
MSQVGLSENDNVFESLNSSCIAGTSSVVLLSNFRTEGIKIDVQVSRMRGGKKSIHNCDGRAFTLKNMVKILKLMLQKF